jgi:hypothetical protein
MSPVFVPLTGFLDSIIAPLAETRSYDFHCWLASRGRYESVGEAVSAQGAVVLSTRKSGRLVALDATEASDSSGVC